MSAEPNPALVAWLLTHSDFWTELMGPNGVFRDTGFPLPLTDIADLERIMPLVHEEDPLPSQRAGPTLFASLAGLRTEDLERMVHLSDFYLLPRELTERIKDEIVFSERRARVVDWFAANGARWTLAFSFVYGASNPKKPGGMYCMEARPTWTADTRGSPVITVGALLDRPLKPVNRLEPTAEERENHAYYHAIRILAGLPVSRENVINSQVAAAVCGALGRMDLLEAGVFGSWNYELVLPAAAAFNRADLFNWWSTVRPAIFGLYPAFSSTISTILTAALNNGSTSVLDMLLRETPEVFGRQPATSNAASLVWLEKHGI